MKRYNRGYHPPMTETAMRRVLESAIRAAGSQREFARRHKLDEGNVSRERAHRTPVTPATLTALGLKRVVTYAKATP